MFENIIEFSSHEEYVDNGEDLPTPIKVHIPEWYKKLQHNVDNHTVKGCMPFLDTLTTGYSLKIPQDISITHNVLNDQNKPDSFYRVGDISDDYFYKKFMNFNPRSPRFHPKEQMEGSPHLEKNKDLPIYKIHNPWLIKTPPGYSCLFLPPMNNTDDRFSIIPGIVDTDDFPIEVNFPYLINGDKYPTLKTLLKKGTPYVQVIPFKRESWKMKITKKSSDEIGKHKAFFWFKILHRYKEKFWKKKSWK